MITKSAFSQEVEKIMNDCDKERKLSMAISEYSGDRITLTNVTELAVTAVRYIILQITEDMEAASKEAEWLVLTTDFGRSVPNITDFDKASAQWGRMCISAYYDYLETAYVTKTQN